MSPDTLPSFERPPVIETVLGVQFDPIPNLSNAHLGAFWYSIRKDWPHVSDAQKLEIVKEQFGAEQTWGRFVELRLSQDPTSRFQIRNNSEDRMIQVQNGRLHFNWLGQQGGPYPRYAEVRPEFDNIWRRFQEFLRSQSLDEPKPNQWEVTYVNHMPKGSVWNDPSDWGKLLPDLGGPGCAHVGINLESFRGEWHFEIPTQRGRLHVKAYPGRKNVPDGDDILRMDLTARGAITGESEKGLSLSAGLDLGHTTIVQAFVALTSEEAKSYWGIRDA